MFIIVFGKWVIRVANLGAMDDRDLAVVGYYRNDDVCTESFVMSIIVFVYGSYKCQILVQLMTVVEGHYKNDDI